VRQLQRDLSQVRGDQDSLERLAKRDPKVACFVAAAAEPKQAAARGGQTREPAP